MLQEIELRPEDFAMKDFLKDLVDGQKDPFDMSLPECGNWGSLASELLDAARVQYARRRAGNESRMFDDALKAAVEQERDLTLLLPEKELAEQRPDLVDEDLIKAMAKPKMPPLEPFVVTDEEGEKYIDPRVELSEFDRQQVRAWLDEIIAYGRKWSPRGPYLFHEALGLWIYSVVAARRIRIPTGDDNIFTPLDIILAAKSGAFAKSTTMRVHFKILEKAGLDWFLWPSGMTPQVLFEKAAGKIPAGYSKFDAEYQERIKKSRAFAGQHGLPFDEFGIKLSLLSQSNSPWSLLHDIMRKWDACPEFDNNDTRSHGENMVIRPYMPVMANMTPDDFKSLPRGSANVWRSGLMGRKAILTPDDKEISYKRRPLAELKVEDEIVQRIRQFHNDLGEPNIEIIEEKDAAGRPTGAYQVNCDKVRYHDTEVSQAAFDAWNNYGDALRYIVNDPTSKHDVPSELHSNYERFHMMAYRIAAIFAWVTNGGKMELKHWAAAQEIVERWRMALHRFFDTVSEGSGLVTPEAERENSIVRILQSHGWLRLHEIKSRTSNKVSTEQLTKILDSLVKAEFVTKLFIKNARGRVRHCWIYGVPGIGLPSGIQVVDPAAVEKAALAATGQGA